MDSTLLLMVKLTIMLKALRITESLLLSMRKYSERNDWNIGDLHSKLTVGDYIRGELVLVLCHELLLTNKVYFEQNKQLKGNMYSLEFECELECDSSIEDRNALIVPNRNYSLIMDYGKPHEGTRVRLVGEVYFETVGTPWR